MISCKEYVEDVKEKLKREIENFNNKPHLAVIQIGNNSASNSYIKGKKKDCEEVGIKLEHVHITDVNDFSQEDLEILIDSLNHDDNVNGIIVQLPIPKKYDTKKIQNKIVPEKDVDGFRRDSLFIPCTPKGIMDWLEYNNINLVGKDVVVIGRSDIVGKPLVNLMIEKGATITCCNSKTKNLKYYTRNADVVISAIGKAKYFDSKYFKRKQLIIDVGINRDENGKLCGDVDGQYIYDSYVTPVPCGVGLLTRISLVQNVVEAYRRTK